MACSLPGSSVPGISWARILDTPVFLPGESQGGEAWWAAVFGVAQSRTRLKQLSSGGSGGGEQGTLEQHLMMGLDGVGEERERIKFG